MTPEDTEKKTEHKESTGIHWSTGNELAFIDRLGTFGNLDATREQLLRGYLMGARKRQVWGNVDREAVIRRCETELGIDSGDSCELCGRSLKR